MIFLYIFFSPFFFFFLLFITYATLFYQYWVSPFKSLHEGSLKPKRLTSTFLHNELFTFDYFVFGFFSILLNSLPLFTYLKLQKWGRKKKGNTMICHQETDLRTLIFMVNMILEIKIKKILSNFFNVENCLDKKLFLNLGSHISCKTIHVLLMLSLSDVLLTATLAQSTGAADYTDCISQKCKTPPTSVLDMTLNNLMLKLQ